MFAGDIVNPTEKRAALHRQVARIRFLGLGWGTLFDLVQYRSSARNRDWCRELDWRFCAALLRSISIFCLRRSKPTFPC